MAKIIVRDIQLKNLIKDKGIKLTANIQLYRQYQKFRGYGAKLREYGGFGVGAEYERTISQNRLAQEFKTLERHPLNKRYTPQELFNVAMHHEIERAQTFLTQKIPMIKTPFKLPRTRAEKAIFKLGIDVAEQPYTEDYEGNTSPDMTTFDPSVIDHLEIYKRLVKKAIVEKMLKDEELYHAFTKLVYQEAENFDFDGMIEDAILRARGNYANNLTKNIVGRAIDDIMDLLESAL